MRLLLLIPFVLAIVAFLIWLTQIVWNAVVPDVFTGMHTITYAQAALLMLLSSLLLRSYSRK